MNWILLFLAGILEVVWVIALKYSEGFTKFLPAAVMVVSITSSFGLLTLSLRTLPLGVAYAVWTGMGAAGAILAGIFLFKEPSNFLQLFFLSLIVVGIVGIKLVSKTA